ncbi:MAG: HK97 family phage prohead protease [Chloroflexi bacterium]|nr:HK97 family phage prohead protease [Chloroflexota bacterium]
MDGFGVWPGSLEIRQEGGARVLLGTFPYGTLATISDRGTVRKETILPRAFRYAIEERERKIDLLVGHEFGKPIASRQSGTLAIADSDDAVTFEATLPPEELTPSWVTDAEKAIANGTMTGLSPGFRVPPRNVVANGESLAPEPGNPGVMIRQVRAGVLREMSVVTAGAYVDAFVELRAELFPQANAVILPGAMTLWL